MSLWISIDCFVVARFISWDVANMCICVFGYLHNLLFCVFSKLQTDLFAYANLNRFERCFVCTYSLNLNSTIKQDETIYLFIFRHL